MDTLLLGVIVVMLIILWVLLFISLAVKVIFKDF